MQNHQCDLQDQAPFGSFASTAGQPRPTPEVRPPGMPFTAGSAGWAFPWRLFRQMNPECHRDDPMNAALFPRVMIAFRTLINC